MPFGLKNAPAEFQYAISKILEDFINRKIVVVYLDDIDDKYFVGNREGT